MEKLTLAQTIDGIEPASKEYEELARKQIEDIAMPPWALGKLCDLAVTLAGIERKVKPTVDKKIILTMAADHGVAEDGVSAFPQEVTVQMAQNILIGGVGGTVMGRAAGAARGSRTPGFSRSNLRRAFLRTTYSSAWTIPAA